jgi:exo-beta-1,3-glucanase (GH17 family)|tara:strand:- start:263 stop:1543 length:1281 start_codon:yes stop_codon:yes gene_type:complete
MKTLYKILSVGVISFMMINCVNKEETNKQDNMKKISAKDILGNPDYLAISYSGYRENSRDIEPTIDQLKEDMKILAAMGIKLLRTYNVQLEQTANLLKTISQLKVEDPNFEMYVMLGAWIDCENAWTNRVPNHEVESRDNAEEIGRAIVLAKKYPTIVKIIAVGNEAMVKWAESYYVQPGVILKWVNHLQGLKKKEELPIDLWITSSDNFASWGGGESEYHVNDLTNLIKAVDYISLHTYPMHDTHYNPAFWGVPNNEQLSDLEKIEVAMLHAKDYAVSQYQSTLNYMKSLGVNKPIHIGETGWASNSNKEYGDHGSKATDEYKEALYYKYMRDWTKEKGISCFYFEAFDESWKDAENILGSENHFGLINLKSQAKYALWDFVDKGVFNGITRDGQEITKTYNGNMALLLNDILVPSKKFKVMNHE